MKEFAKGIKTKALAFESKHKYLSYAIVAAIISFFIVITSSALASFVYPHLRADEFTNDPQFFFLTGQMIKNGAKPYIDINDHKGLYVFMYETLVAYLGGRFGLFLCEFVTTCISLFFLQLTFDEMKISRRTSITMMLVYWAAMAAFFQYNNTEEIQIVFLFPATYFYVRGFIRKSDKDFLIGNILWGVQAGVTFNIRASDIMFAFAAVCFYAYYMLRRKKFVLCLRDAAVFLGSFAISCAPAYIIAYSQGYLHEMWESAIVANISYTSGVGSDYATGGVFAVVLFVSLFSYFHFTNIKYMERDEWMFFLINFGIIGLYQILIAKFPHYWIMCFPMMLVYFGRIISLRGLDKKAAISKGMSYFALVACLAASLVQPAMYYKSLYPQEASLISYVKSNIDEADLKDKTIMVDCSSGYYLALGINPHHKDFVMQTWHSNFEDSVVTGLKEYLDSGECKYVIINVTSQGIIRGYLESHFDLVGSKSDNPYCDIYIKR